MAVLWNGPDADSTYDRLLKQLQTIESELSILAGDEYGPTNASWQDVAGTAAVNLRVYADMLDSLRKSETHFAGRYPWSGVVSFPSIRDICDGSEVPR